MQIFPVPAVMREPGLYLKQLLLPPVHDNKLFTPTAVLSEAVETAYKALLPTAVFDLPKVRPFRQSIPRELLEVPVTVIGCGALPTRIEVSFGIKISP